MSFEGNWQLTIDSPMGERPASLSITETIGNLEGSLTTGMGTAPVSGRADEDFVAFSASVQGPMGAVKLDFTGTFTGDEVSGEMQFGSMGGGRWNGARIGAEDGGHPTTESYRATHGGNVQSAVASVENRGGGDTRPGPGIMGTMDQPTGQGVGSFRPIATLKRTFNSLGVTSYRNLWIGFLLQMGGMQMLLFTGGYYIFELTGSASLLGIAIASAAIPAVSLALLGGVFADRFEKKRVIQAGQGVSLLVALFVAVSISTGTITWAHLVAASFVQGSAMPLMMPARQAIVPQLVGMGRIQNAIALNSMVMSLSFMVFPAVAGVLIAAVGIEAVYYTISGMYLGGLFFTQLLPKLEVVSRDAPTTILGDIRDGLKYVSSNRIILLLMFLSLITVVLAMPIRFILPIFAKDVFEVGPDRLGYLGGVMGLGALGGTLVIATLGKVARRGLALAVSGILSGLTLLGFAAMSYFAPTYIAALAILALVGLIQAGRMTLNSSLMMEYADQAYRGRVMSLFSLVMGIMPAGVLPITIMTDRLGAPIALGVMAVLLILVATTMLLASPRLRQLE